MKSQLEDISRASSDRFEWWTRFIAENKFRRVAEVGVYRGDFAQRILQACPVLEEYIMIDPWRHLSDWNKPANLDNSTFDAFYKETLEKTDFAKEKRIILRGKTTEVIDQIADDSLDFIYIDGDHTLKGITIDLINLWPKIKSSGFVGGDDFKTSIWQHSTEFEPTFVFPYAVYFSEAVNSKVYGLPYEQFLIAKPEEGYQFTDLTAGAYPDTTVQHQVQQRLGLRKYSSGLKTTLVNTFPSLHKLYQKVAQ